MINRNKRAVLWRRRRWRPSLAELALLLLLVAAIGAGVRALGSFIGASMAELRDDTIATLNFRIGRQITYGRISPSLLRAFEIRDLTIFSAEAANEPLVAINRIRIRYSLARLILLRDPVAALREIQLINSDFAVNLDRDLELRQFVQQFAAVRAGESNASTPVDGGSARLDSLLPIDLSGANLGLVIEDGGYRFDFEQLFFRARSGEQLRLTARGTLRARLPVTDPVGLAIGGRLDARVQIDGHLSSDLREADLSVRLDDLATSTFSVAPHTLNVALRDQQLQAASEQRDGTLGLKLNHDFGTGSSTLTVSAAELRVADVIQLNSPHAVLELLLAAVVSGTGSLRNAPEGTAGGGGVQYEVELSGSIPGGPNSPPGTVTAAVSGDGRLMQVAHLQADTANGAISFSGTVLHDGLLPEGELVVRAMDAGLPAPVDARLTVTRAGKELVLRSERIAVGQASLHELQVNLRPATAAPFTYRYQLSAKMAQSAASSIDARGQLNLAGNRRLTLAAAIDGIAADQAYRLLTPPATRQAWLEQALTQRTLSGEIEASTDFQTWRLRAPAVQVRDARAVGDANAATAGSGAGAGATAAAAGAGAGAGATAAAAGAGAGAGATAAAASAGASTAAEQADPWLQFSLIAGDTRLAGDGDQRAHSEVRVQELAADLTGYRIRGSARLTGGDGGGLELETALAINGQPYELRASISPAGEFHVTGNHQLVADGTFGGDRGVQFSGSASALPVPLPLRLRAAPLRTSLAFAGHYATTEDWSLESDRMILAELPFTIVADAQLALAFAADSQGVSLTDFSYQDDAIRLQGIGQFTFADRVATLSGAGRLTLSGSHENYDLTLTVADGEVDATVLGSGLPLARFGTFPVVGSLGGAAHVTGRLSQPLHWTAAVDLENGRLNADPVRLAANLGWADGVLSVRDLTFGLLSHQLQGGTGEIDSQRGTLTFETAYRAEYFGDPVEARLKLTSEDFRFTPAAPLAINGAAATEATPIETFAAGVSAVLMADELTVAGEPVPSWDLALRFERIPAAVSGSSSGSGGSSGGSSGSGAGGASSGSGASSSGAGGGSGSSSGSSASGASGSSSSTGSGDPPAAPARSALQRRTGRRVLGLPVRRRTVPARGARSLSGTRQRDRDLREFPGRRSGRGDPCRHPDAERPARERPAREQPAGVYRRHHHRQCADRRSAQRPRLPRGHRSHHRRQGNLTVHAGGSGAVRGAAQHGGEAADHRAVQHAVGHAAAGYARRHRGDRTLDTEPLQADAGDHHRTRDTAGLPVRAAAVRRPGRRVAHPDPGRRRRRPGGRGAGPHGRDLPRRLGPHANRTRSAAGQAGRGHRPPRRIHLALAAAPDPASPPWSRASTSGSSSTAPAATSRSTATSRCAAASCSTSTVSS